MFVDDDPTVRRTFARVVRRQGFIVDLAETGERALQLATHYAYAVVVTDLRMTGLDGATLIDQLRQLRPGSSYLLVTGADDEEALGRIREVADVAEVIRKPWDNAELCDAIERGFASFIRESSDSAPAPSVPYGPKRLLLIEDDRAEAMLTQNHLRDVAPDEYVIRWAATLADAERAMGEERFSLILSDLGLPDSQGLDTVHRVRETAGDTPLIVLSSADDQRLALRAVEAGVQDFLIKSDVSADLLHRSIRYALERKRTDARLKFLARHDALTGLANRALLQERLAQSISHSQRGDRLTALMVLDLSQFKAVNDQLGHEIGDRVLQEAANRLLSSVSETDTVARLGGDEFAIVLDQVARHADATPVAERVLASFATPFEVGDEEVKLEASLGICFAPDNGETTDVLLKCAGSALIESKDSGPGRYRFFDAQLHNKAVRKQAFEAELQQAVAQGQFTLHYQPQVSLVSGAVVGCEALLRWNRPDGQVVLPIEVIAPLEESGQIVQVGAWVLQQACSQLSTWKLQGYGNDLRIAVNVSPLQLQSPDFLDVVRGALERTDTRPECLELELSERASVDDSSRAMTTMRELAQMGVRLAIDDFGSGASSLMALSELPLSTLKIDLDFVTAMFEQPRRAVVVEAAIKLAQTFGFETVAEGVETEDQQRKLARLGCTTAQGFHIGRPQAALNAAGWMRDHQRASNF